MLHTSFALACAQSVPPGSVRRVFLIPAAQAGAGGAQGENKCLPTEENVSVESSWCSSFWEKETSPSPLKQVVNVQRSRG